MIEIEVQDMKGRHLYSLQSPWVPDVGEYIWEGYTSEHHVVDGRVISRQGNRLKVVLIVK